ncbi:cytochrome P450 2C9-like [Panonychus citri]|uniref:cytochrome P450 2C9-like n=1 Tax=Panonychus citri TaxID=50023 RepID=UPI002307556F|nr:cytochrome P450 2C9-like [Panonychus citri]
MFPLENHQLIVGLFSIFLVNYLIKFLIRLWRFPPGPLGFPIVGYLPFIKKDTHKQFTELAQKYGPVFSLRIGSFNVVVINGWTAIKEAFADDNLLARPNEDYFTIVGDQSIAEMSGDKWREQRRVTLTTLRNVGLGKTKMEETIREEINCFIEKIKKETGKPLDAGELLSTSVPNNISTLLFGHKFDYDDPRNIELESNFRKLQVSGSFINGVVYMPWLAKLILRFKFLFFKKILDALAAIEKCISDEIDQHQQSDEEIVDYVDGFLQEMKKRSDDNETTFTIKTLKRNALTFYSAGSDTIRFTLEWMMQILVAQPEFQDKIREEIYQVLGRERSPDNIDRQLMPYTMAFIYEAQRYSSIVPINLPRRTTKETIITGMTIPEDAVVLFNFWSVHRDENLYPDPEKFDPKRFLNEDQSKAIKPPYLLTFSGGKRVCPGESFANLQLFLYLVNIVQNFNIKSASEGEISLKGNYMFTRFIKDPVKLIFTEINADC